MRFAPWLGLLSVLILAGFLIWIYPIKVATSQVALVAAATFFSAGFLLGLSVFLEFLSRR